MKTARISTIIIFYLLASACSTAPMIIPEKYNLDDQMENVPGISRFNMMGWERVDTQSFILQTGPNDYYLIILDTKSPTLPSSNTIEISNTGYMVWPGYNNVIVNDDGFEDTYVINRIYKFKDYDQVKAIKARLCGKAR